MRLPAWGLALPALLLLSGCGLWDSVFGSPQEPPLPGERVAVLQQGTALTPDPQLPPPTLPAAEVNAEWRQPGGVPSHVPGHPMLNHPFKEVWSTDIGQGTDRDHRLLTQPIVAAGKLFVADGGGHLTALDATTGRQLWHVRVAEPGEDTVPIGGGPAFDNGVLYATTGFGDVVALDPANGGLIWKTKAEGPIRAAPTVVDGRVFTITVDNEMQAFDASTGQEIWDHTGIESDAELLGGASPAVAGGVVIAPYSSGELFALRVENGRPVWSDNLIALRQIGALASMADIRGMPVIDGNLVVAISHSDRLVGIDARTGSRVWELNVGGEDMPWIAGDTVFILTIDAEVAALDRATGGVRWATALPRYADEDRLDPIVWSGPVLANGRLIVVSNKGEAQVLDAVTGAILGGVRLNDDATVAPIVANGTLYQLTEDGVVTAYR